MLSKDRNTRRTIMIDTGLKNKVVLITGGNNKQGIGAAAAKAFAAEGAAVFIHYFRVPLPKSEQSLAEEMERVSTPGPSLYRKLQAEPIDDIIKAIKDRGGRVEAWEADLADPAVIPQLFDQVEANFGPVDVLVNNAAYGESDTFIPQSQLKGEECHVAGFPMQAISAEGIDKHFAVNSRAVALMMAQYAQRNIERGTKWGRIINISADGASGFPSEVSYDASKHALESFSRAAARELGKYGITVNIVSPGPVQSGYIPPELEQLLLADIPLGRIGQPEDIADAIVFLASEQARWITGELLYVTGGNRMPL
jgi:3-oxoacyl-[acyl-carrier protein] reductase